MNAGVLAAVAVLAAVVNAGEGWFAAWAVPALCLVAAAISSPLGDRRSVGHEEAQALAVDDGRVVIYHRPG